jgi:hypothetical protein
MTSSGLQYLCAGLGQMHHFVSNGSRTAAPDRESEVADSKHSTALAKSPRLMAQALLKSFSGIRRPSDAARTRRIWRGETSPDRRGVLVGLFRISRNAEKLPTGFGLLGLLISVMYAK